MKTKLQLFTLENGKTSVEPEQKPEENNVSTVSVDNDPAEAKVEEEKPKVEENGRKSRSASKDR